MQVQQQIIEQPFICKCQLGRKEKKIRRTGLRIRPEFISEIYRQYDISLPMEKVDFNVIIQNNIATTELTQVYKNYYNRFIDAEYIFPISPDSCFVSFTAEYDGKTIQGVVKEKQEAKKEFQEHKEQGNMVAMSHISDDTKDMMKIDIANIQPNVEIKIKYIYSEELQTSMNKFWMYKILSTVSPRYCNSSVQEPEFQNIQWKKVHENFKTNIKFLVKSDSPIEFFRTPQYNFENYQENMNKTSIVAEINDIKFEKDLTLLYLDQNINKPSVILGKTDIQTCAQVNFVPNFNNLATVDDAFQAQLQDSQTFDVDMNKSKAEFIFLIDRSGSMGGSRINSAVEALQIFLQSLPQGSYFNVVSFGSRYEKMFSTSIDYNQQTLQQAQQQIKGFTANFGGTQIFQPLADVIFQDKMKNMPRQIFLLTDGDISQPEQVIQLAKKQIKTTRVHTIGIGSGCSQYLVKETAKAGRGLAKFIADNDDINGQIIELLDSALSPCLDNFELEFNHDMIDFIAPNPSSIPIVLKNDPISFYIFFKPGIQGDALNTQIKLKYYDSIVEQYLEYVLDVNEGVPRDDNVFKMGIHKTIAGLQSSLDNYNIDQEIDNMLQQYGIKKSIKQVRQQKVLKAEQCSKGHTLTFMGLDHEKIGYMVCDECKQYCVKNKVGTYRCYQCDFDRCENCHAAQSTKKCNKGHSLKYYDINSKKIQYIQCDICNYTPKSLGVGTNRCEQCDFDICDNCFEEEQKKLKGAKQQVKITQIDMIEIEDEQQKCKTEFDDVYFAKQISAKDEIISMSTQNQVLSSLTAFLCVIDELDDTKKQQFQNQKVIQPQIIKLEQQIENNYQNIQRKRNSRKSMASVPQYSQMQLKYKNYAIPQINIYQSKHISPQLHSNTNLMSSMFCGSKSEQKHQEKSQNCDMFDAQDDDDCEEEDNEEEQNCRSNSSYMSEQKDQKTESKYLIQVLQLQNIDGSWSQSQQLLSMIGLKQQQISQEIQNNIQYWITWIVLVWLEKYNSSKQNTWKLISRKAQDFLRKQNSQFQQDKQQAVKLI